LASLHSEMASLRLECDRLINKHLMVEKTLSEGCILCPNPDTSSAYNTGGESCRSNSITPDGTVKPSPPQLTASYLFHEYFRYFRSIQTKDKLYIIEKPVEEANEISDDHGIAAGPSEKNPDQPCQTNDTIVYKWKVKRRCDGSRYVVKRPARSQILKKRAAQLIRERTGISTDDDAMSELKLGHFHTREERKKHLEEERRRKIRNQQKLIESKISPADQMIVQLSQRKMQRRKEKMLLDGFVTTQEVLSQRNPDTTAKHGILSVTTV
uniref:CUPID domain-containing protein n=1 Tax=Haemonchus placei TaxID=6290 RepID=A0A158QQR7_HAEPC